MEDDGEIEYLDEDEDIVQQCVQSTSIPPITLPSEAFQLQDIEEQITPLLVEKKPTVNDTKRRYKSEEDSDYNPSEDIRSSPPPKKKKKTAPRKTVFKQETMKIQSIPISSKQSSTQNVVKSYENKLKSLPNLTVQKQTVPKKEYSNRYGSNRKDSISFPERKKLDIRIPDYEDPLCLPVRALKRDSYELKKLKQWNDLCLDQFKQADSVLASNRGTAVSSTRTVILRNVKRRNSDKIDTVICGKTVVQNEYEEKKELTFQATLPKYREKKVLNNYPLLLGPRRLLKHTFEVVLTTEEDKGEKSLVVYKPKECISAVYKFLENNKSEEDCEAEARNHIKRVLKEVACCKVCAPCYQLSWRGVSKHKKPSELKCCICGVSLVTIYSLLTHLNTNHLPADVHRYKDKLSQMCAEVLDYHYRCKICQEKYNSIKVLRQHVTRHQGFEVFRCEIGNHMAS